MTAVQQIRNKNTMEVIRLVKDLESFTKGELMEQTKLTLVTINKIVNSLLEKEILVETGVAASNGGRKPSLYRLNPRKYYLVGVSLHTGRFDVSIADLRMTELVRSQTTVPEHAEIAEIAALLESSIRSVMKQASVAEDQIAMLGVTVQGPVQRETGRVHLLPDWPMWKDVPLGDMLQKRFSFPVVVEKDTFAALLFLKNRGLLDVNRSAIYLKISRGVGASVFICGNLYRGKGDIAGELGHVSVETDGRKCRCGSFGCLEAYVSDPAIEKSVRAQLKDGASSKFLQDSKPDSLSIQDLINAARMGDTLCLNALKSAARYLGIAISNLVKTLNPDVIYLDCEWINALPSLLDAVTDASRARTSIFDDQAAFISAVELPDMGMKGAIALALDCILKDDQSSILLR